MNYLALCQRLRMEAGVSGTGPSAVTGQTGELGEIVTWVNAAYEDIQSLHTTWLFRQDDFSVSLISGTYTYTPASLSIDDLLEWKTDDVRIYLDAADEAQITYTPWDDFRRAYMIGSLPSGRPSVFSVKPNNSIVFWPTPDGAYTCVGEYVKQVDTLSGNTDTPIFPSDFHMLIVWRALKYYAGLLAAPEKYAHGEAEYQRLMRAMENSQLPKIGWGNPLA